MKNEVSHVAYSKKSFYDQTKVPPIFHRARESEELDHLILGHLSPHNIGVSGCTAQQATLLPSGNSSLTNHGIR